MDSFLKKELACIDFEEYFLNIQKTINKLYPTCKTAEEKLEKSKKILKACYSTNPEEFVPVFFDVDDQTKQWLIGFMYIEKFVVNQIWGASTFSYVNKYTEKHQQWFYDKVHIILCLLYYNISFFKLENILQTHFKDHITPLPLIYEYQYYFLNSLVNKAEESTKKLKGRPSYPLEIVPILDTYRKKKNQSRMRKKYYEKHFTEADVFFLYSLCKEHACDKHELLNKLQTYLD